MTNENEVPMGQEDSNRAEAQKAGLMRKRSEKGSKDVSENVSPKVVLDVDWSAFVVLDSKSLSRQVRGSF